MDSPEFVLATVHPADPKNPSSQPLPRVRTLIMRGFWAEMPDNKHQEAEMNERVYETDLPCFTTDVRMEKVPDIFATSAGHGLPEQSQGSGGGGPVEAMWWIKDSMTQWRMKGQAFVVGNDIEGEGEESSGVRTVRSEIGARMKVVNEDGVKDWSWQREMTAHFGNLAPYMRGKHGYSDTELRYFS
jgi:pyridoxamine 5'-phosphate oxidase